MRDQVSTALEKTKTANFRLGFLSEFWDCNHFCNCHVQKQPNKIKSSENRQTHNRKRGKPY